MVAPTTRENAAAMIVVLLVLALASASVYHHRQQIEVRPGVTLDQALNPSPTPTYVSTIPTSSAGAQDYLNRASDAASMGDYAKAAQILQQAAAAYPDDENVALTLGYYQNLAKSYGQ